jgi:hypothetical protein
MIVASPSQLDVLAAVGTLDIANAGGTEFAQGGLTAVIFHDTPSWWTD